MFIRFRLTFLAAACVAFATNAATQTVPTNVLIIYTDEQRADSLGVMGNPDIDTPNLDALAGDGVLYKNSFCVWPVCTPSRLSILSGQYVQQHGGRSNRSTLPVHIPTFASILRDAGYNTEAVGKMHITPAYQDIGFSKMILAEQNGRGRNVDDYHRYLKDNGLINADDLIDQERRFRSQAPDEYWNTFGARTSDLADEHHITTWVADRAMESVSSWKQDSSNLLMVGFLKPHHPFDPPAPWDEYYDPVEMTILPGWTEAVPEIDRKRARGYFDNATLRRDTLQRVIAYYYATITHIDHHVGRIIEELKRKDLYDNTLIVYTSDHGEYLGFHHRILKGNHMYDPLVKVPLIVKFPGQRHAGAVSEDLVNSLDVTATIIAETGERPAPDMRGFPLGKSTPGLDTPRSYVITQDSRSIMIRTHQRKLIINEDPKQSLFFDLVDDPYEFENQIDNSAYAEDIALLKDAALSWLVKEAPRAALVDESVPLIASPNVPENLERTEQEMLKYFKQRVEPELKRNE